MNKYELIVESLCDAVAAGDITEEFANEVNLLAYEKCNTPAAPAKKSIMDSIKKLGKKETAPADSKKIDKSLVLKIAGVATGVVVAITAILTLYLKKRKSGNVTPENAETLADTTTEKIKVEQKKGLAKIAEAIAAFAKKNGVKVAGALAKFVAKAKSWLILITSPEARKSKKLSKMSDEEVYDYMSKMKVMANDTSDLEAFVDDNLLYA